MEESGVTAEISIERYHSLLESEEQLIALEAGGVSTWEWYSESLEPYWVKKAEEENEEI